MSTSDNCELIEAIYAAAEDPQGWSGFLELLVRRLPYDVAGIQVYDHVKRSASVSVDFGLDAAARASYETYYCMRNPWMNDTRSLSPGAVLSSEEILPASQYHRTEFCQDFGIPNRIEHSLGCNLSTRGRTVAYLSVSRASAGGAFTEEEQRTMTLLVPHIRRSIDLSQRLAALELHRDTFMESASAIFTLDAKRRLVDMNPEAARLLDSDVLLTASNGLLAAREPNRKAFLRLATGVPDTETMIDSEGEEYTAKTVAVSEKWRIFDSHACMVLIVRQSMGAHARSLSGRVGIQFSLTAAERRLIEVLVGSRTLNDAAATLSISPNTAKTHLSRVLRKTGTSNQRQLIQLVSRFHVL